MTLYSPDVPAGFDEFWRETTDEALAAPLDVTRRPQDDVDRDGFTIDVLSFRGVQGATLHGWFAVPAPTPAPAFLWIAPYGRWSMMPNEYGTREGFCSLSFNFFGEHAFHSESYKPERGYLTEGIESPSTWVFRRLYQESVIAGRVLQSFSEVRAGKIGAMGMSQGGGLSVWLGAFWSAIGCVVGDMPFGAARPIVFSRDIHRYPLREAIDWWGESSSRKAQALETMRWFDTVNMATGCSVPTLLSYGLKDPAVREYEVRSVYEALPGEKQIFSIDGGHDWHESMVDRNAAWLRRWLD